MKMLDLCSGIAGISMAADWVGIETAAFCEIEEFNQKVLRKNYPNIPIFPDLYKLTKQSLIDGGVDVDSIGVISAGYPCQGESLVGKRKGAEHLLLATPTTSQNYKPIRELCPSEANGSHGKTLPGSIGEHFPEHIGKKINPQFVEWMMGLPQDWTKID